MSSSSTSLDDLRRFVAKPMVGLRPRPAPVIVRDDVVTHVQDALTTIGACSMSDGRQAHEHRAMTRHVARSATRWGRSACAARLARVLLGVFMLVVAGGAW